MENSINASKQVSVDSQDSVVTDPVAAQNELQQLTSIISNWKEISGELKTLNEQVREKRKRLKVMKRCFSGL